MPPFGSTFLPGSGTSPFRIQRDMVQYIGYQQRPCGCGQPYQKLDSGQIQALVAAKGPDKGNPSKDPERNADSLDNFVPNAHTLSLLSFSRFSQYGRSAGLSHLDCNLFPVFCHPVLRQLPPVVPFNGPLSRRQAGTLPVPVVGMAAAV